MNTVVATAEEVKLANKAMEMVFQLTNRQNSRWVKKGTENTPNPRHLNAPRAYLLPMRSREWYNNEIGYVQIQYVPGAPTIYVNDVKDKSGKVLEQGLLSMGYNLERLDKEYERAVLMNICFRNGQLDLREYGSDATLLKFVQRHEDNGDAKANTEKVNGRPVRDNRRNMQFLFKAVRNEEKAQKELSTFDDKFDAMVFMSQLRTKDSEGYVYNQPLLNAVCSIFGIAGDLAADESNQRMQRVLVHMNKDAKEFTKTIAETFDEYSVAIRNAEKYKVLDLSKAEVSMLIGDELRTLIKTSNDEERKMQELSCYFIADMKGVVDFSNMQAEVSRKQAEEIVRSKV